MKKKLTGREKILHKISDIKRYNNIPEGMKQRLIEKLQKKLEVK
jgi:hypothetical protein